MLTLEHVTVRYGRKTAVEDISLHLSPGQWLMLCGPNGAGKSTLLRAIDRALPYEGKILVEGQDAAGIRPARFARLVGMLAQASRVEYAFTVEEIVGMGCYAHRRGLLAGGEAEDETRIEKALADTGLTELRHASAAALSGGELQRVFLAQVFAQDPDILLLDEPANHLDLKYQRHTFGLIADWLQGGRRAVITVAHDLSLARRYGDTALLLDAGRCAALGPADQVFTPDRLQAVYDMDVCGWMRELLSMWED